LREEGNTEMTERLIELLKKDCPNKANAASVYSGAWHMLKAAGFPVREVRSEENSNLPRVSMLDDKNRLLIPESTIQEIKAKSDLLDKAYKIYRSTPNIGRNRRNKVGEKGLKIIKAAFQGYE
jgi:hypothetical protein